MSSTPPPFYLLFLLLLFLHTPLTATATTTPYFSKTTLFSDYEKMYYNLKIFVYPPPSQHNLNNLNETLPPPLSHFYTSLLTSHFITHDPTQANLFFLPFRPQSTRSLARYIQTIRTSYPYWDFSLGADHFYLTCNGVGSSSSRNVVELKKNAVQVTCFPSPVREFIPHKDVTLPPQLTSLVPPRSEEDDMLSTRFLGYWRYDDRVRFDTELISGLRNDTEFVVESEPLDEKVHAENIQRSRFCIFVYGEGLVGLGEALVQGCVPVVITDRPIQDFPLMDVIRWSEIALFVGWKVKAGEFKHVLKRTCESGRYERMRGLGVAVAHHLVWSEELSKPYDAFNMVMYQLWLRRHAIRYAPWDHVQAAST